MPRKPLVDTVLANVGRAHARRVLSVFLRAAERARTVQEAALQEKIRRNADTAFGRDHGFASIRSYEDFRRQLPILTYEDLAPYVERVKNGELTAMFGRGQRVHMFAMTSGTADQPKYVPVTDAFLREYRRGWNAFGVKALIDHPESFLRPILQVVSPMDEQLTPAGIPCGAITGLMAATQKRIVRRYYITPPCVGYIADAASRYYTIARLAMAGDLGFSITANPATHLRIARAAEDRAEDIIRDIRDGTLDVSVDVPETVRGQLAPRLGPDRDRAAFLENIVGRTGHLVPKHVWDIGFVANWTGGTMGLYLQDFPEYFGDTPVRDIGLLASEGRVSVPLEDGTAAGVLDVSANFYEFIPERECDSDHPVVLRAHELEPGGIYSVMLTTSAGFYRYRIGDYVRVVDYHGEAPLVEFLHKGAHISSLSGEKLTEQQVVRAFERACRALSLPAALFVLAPQWADPPFYRLHLAGDALRNRDSDALAAALNEELRTANIEYACKQDSGRLGPVETNLLPEGFLSRREANLQASRRGRYEQYKHRYLLNAPNQDSEFPIRCARAPAG